MDDTCAVCADVLEWVAYGACGHRDVCSTCVARLRFICDDRRCCICKTESACVFVTKALGEYTRMINDFSLLPSEPREGRIGQYWYHEDTNSFFDDSDQYKMIKAMCRLSCSVCDKVEEEGPPSGGDGPKRRPSRFKNIEHLKGHIFHKHRMMMCSLCLEGRKVFICEQKLYTRVQLNQHISSGDSEVDGNESDRGGFAGHPSCEFCKTPFYGDNELYLHMSTEHYTCHMCQRQHPGQYEYYRNYDDLEMHFRRDHYLCEDEGCLAKKFVVFQTETEMKRHNTLEHGGRMSRSRRNAALQIPISFCYRRSSEQGNRHGRRRTFIHDQANDDISLAIEASIGTAQLDVLPRNASSSSTGGLVTNTADVDDTDSLIKPFELLNPTGAVGPRYLHALSQNSGNGHLAESLFPPLPVTSSSNQPNLVNVRNDALLDNTMAARLRKKNNKKANAAKNAAPAWPTASQGYHVSHNSKLAGVSTSSSQPGSSSDTETTTSAYPDLSLARVPIRGNPINGLSSSAFPSNLVNGRKMTHSSSAPSLAATGSKESLVSDFPPVSARKVEKVPIRNEVPAVVEDVQAANKYLVEKLRNALQNDESKFVSFKEISAQYRQGVLSTENYLDCVEQYGLTQLVPDLANLCPDPQKGNELVESYRARTKQKGKQETSARSKKGKIPVTESSSSRDKLATDIINTVRTLQSQKNHGEEVVEVLSRDGYRSGRGTSNLVSGELTLNTIVSSAVTESSHDSGDGRGGTKTKKKTSKFHRMRLGDGSMAALLDDRNSDTDSCLHPNGEMLADGDVPVRGVWRKGGVQRLFL